MSSYTGNEAPGYYGATAKPKRRRMVNCVGPDDGATVETFYADDTKGNDPLRYTTCMSHHVMARIEDDVKRAKMRDDNPESAIPSRGYDYDQDASRAVEEYRTTQQLPRSSNVVAATLYSPGRSDFALPSISPASNRSRRGSANTSRQPSQGNSTATSPSNQSRGAGQSTSARRPGRQARATPNASQQPSGRRSRSTSRYNNRNNNNSSTGVSNSSSPVPHPPAGGRLQPLDTEVPAIASHQRREHDEDGRVAAPSGHHAKAHKKLFLEPSSFEDEEAVTPVDAERQRRLRLAEELALQMDSVAI